MTTETPLDGEVPTASNGLASRAALAWKGLSLRTEAAVASAIVGLLTVASVIGLRWSLYNAEQRSAWTLHTREVIAAAQATARSAAEAQNAARGYALTHDRFFAERSLTSNDEFNRTVGVLRGLEAENPEQLRRVDDIQALFVRWRSEAAASRPGPSAGEQAEGHRITSTQLPGAIQEIVDDLVTAESRWLQEKERASLTSSRKVVRASFFGTVFVVVIGGVGVILFANRVGNRLARLTESAQAIAHGDLHRRVAVVRDDEIGSLARSFNRMAEQLDRQRREEVALNRMREMLHAAQSTADAERVITQIAPQCLPANAGRLFLFNEARNLLRFAAGWGEGLGSEPFGPDECWSFRVGRLYEVRDPSLDVACVHRQGVGCPTLCFPLMAQGETVGLLHLAYDGHAVPGMATQVGEMLALTLANLRMREAMRDQALRDPLTGLFNRRFLDETFRRELSRAARTGRPVGVVVMDIDHFKRVNDTYGHAGGDAVLKEIATLLLASFRANDVVCRCGGEEFVAVLPECDLEDAVRRAEALRLAAHGLRASSEGRVIDHITVSAGVAVYPDHGRNPEALTQAADSALYRSKSEGRDRVTSAETLPTQ